MTKPQAKAAIDARAKVTAGTGEDRDTGRIVELRGSMAIVAWDSGVRTPCPIIDLIAA